MNTIVASQDSLILSRMGQQMSYEMLDKLAAFVGLPPIGTSPEPDRIHEILAAADIIRNDDVVIACA